MLPSLFFSSSVPRLRTGAYVRLSMSWTLLGWSLALTFRSKLSDALSSNILYLYSISWLPGSAVNSFEEVLFEGTQTQEDPESGSFEACRQARQATGFFHPSLMLRLPTTGLKVEHTGRHGADTTTRTLGPAPGHEPGPGRLFYGELRVRGLQVRGIVWPPAVACGGAYAFLSRTVSCETSGMYHCFRVWWLRTAGPRRFIVTHPPWRSRGSSPHCCPSRRAA